MKPSTVVFGRAALVVIAIAAVAILLLSSTASPLTLASRRRSPLGPPRGQHEDVSRLEEPGESAAGTMAARGSLELPNAPVYSTAVFCPQTTPGPTPEPNVCHMPWVMRRYDPAYYRYGVSGADKGNDARGECPGTNDMADLGLIDSLSYDWKWGDSVDTNQVQMVYSPSGEPSDDLAYWAEAHPRRVWILGNEPDQAGPDEMCPELYAEGYYDYRRKIRDGDPLARIAIGGISQTPTITTCTSASYTWQTYITTTLEHYLDTYGEVMPIDVWTIHRYPIHYLDDSARSVEEWKTGDDGYGPGVITMTNFIRDLDVDGDEVNEYAGTPIWLTEYGMFYWKAHNHGQDSDIQGFMEGASNWLESYGEIERWFWFVGASGHTNKGCWQVWSWSGYLIQQDQADSRGQLTMHEGSTTTLKCPTPNCGVSGVDWDRYSILYVVFNNVMYMRRVAAFDPETDTITICFDEDGDSDEDGDGPFPHPVKIGTWFRVVRQVPHFTDGYLEPNKLGKAYCKLATGLDQCPR